MTFRTEAEFQSAVCQLAKTLGCITFHPKNVKRSEPGFPDLTIVGRSGFVFRELKGEKGRVSDEQRFWLDRLNQAGANADVWRPADWPERVTRELQEIA